MMKQLRATKASLKFTMARFILKQHTNPILNAIAKLAAWVNRKRFGKNTLDFLEEPNTHDTEF